jgi:hypothetical protein
MRRFSLAVALMFIALAPAMVRAEENQGGAGHMLPLCKSWLRVASKELDAVKNELATGDAKPGGIVMHLTLAGMVVGAFETLRIFGSLCPPDNVSNEQCCLRGQVPT